MPYLTNADLPPGVHHHLPPHAQDIFREVFNRAWKQYANPEQRWMGGTREEVANRVAWAAVKKKYYKVGDEWVERKFTYSRNYSIP